MSGHVRDTPFEQGVNYCLEHCHCRDDQGNEYIGGELKAPDALQQVETS